MFNIKKLIKQLIEIITNVLFNFIVSQHGAHRPHLDS